MKKRTTPRNTDQAAIEVLTWAVALYERSPDVRTTGTNARDPGNEPVAPTASRACRWSLAGLVELAMHRTGHWQPGGARRWPGALQLHDTVVEQSVEHPPELRRNAREPEKPINEWDDRQQYDAALEMLRKTLARTRDRAERTPQD